LFYFSCFEALRRIRPYKPLHYLTPKRYIYKHTKSIFLLPSLKELSIQLNTDSFDKARY